MAEFEEAMEAHLDSVADLDMDSEEPATATPVYTGAPSSDPNSGLSRAGYSALLDAAIHNDMDQMQVILSNEDAPEWWLASAFLNAVASGSVVAPRWLLDNGLSANAMSEAGLPLINVIVQQSPPNTEILAALLDHGARCNPGSMPLIWLSGYADHQHDAEGLDEELEQQIIDLLPRFLDQGAVIDATDERGCTALHWAAQYRSAAFVDALVELDIEVDARDRLGRSALFVACETVRAERSRIIRSLTKAGADPKLADEEGHTAMTVAMEAQDQTLLKMLMLARKGLEMKPKESSRHDNLIQAAEEGNLGRVKRLLARGDDVNQRDSKGCTALLRACGAGHPTVVSSLLAANANLDIPARNGTTPIGAAVMGNHKQIVRLLADRGASVDQPQQFGITPLMLSAARWQAGMLSDLLKLGADPAVRDEAENTALMAAVQNALITDDPDAAAATVQALLDHGVEVNAINDEGQSALMLLLGVRARHTESARTETVLLLTHELIKQGADLDIQDLTGWSALHAAAAHGFLEPARALIEAGANKRLRDINGLSPTDLAMDNGHDQLVDLFIQP
jgi:ankyrin repeat protein